MSLDTSRDEKLSNQNTSSKPERNYHERTNVEVSDEIPYWRDYGRSIEEIISPPLGTKMETSYTNDPTRIDDISINQKVSEFSESKDSKLEDFENHPRITVNNDTELKEYADMYGWPGEGTENRPYMIQGYAFDGMGGKHAVHFGNVNDHFVLKENYIYNSTAFMGAGLVLSSTQNAIIEDNIFIENENGLDIWGSSNNTIEGNDISQNQVNGILIEGGIYNNINNNTISDNDEGAVLFNTEENNLGHNTITDNRFGISLVENSEKNNISANTIEGSQKGITLQHSDGNILEENSVSEGSIGISITSSSRNHINGNIIEGSEDGGIVLTSTFSTVISSNSMEECGLFIQGNILDHYNTHEIDIENTVNSEPVHYLKNQNEGSVQSPAGQVILANTTGVQIQGLDVSNGCIGLHLAYSEDNILVDIVSSSNNRYGLVLENSDMNLVKKSSFQRNQEGLSIHDSLDNTFLNNSVSDNSGGFVLSHSTNNQLVNNTVDVNQNGIDIWDSDNVKLESNLVLNNTRYGVILSESKNSLLRENALEGHGVFLEGASKEYWNTHEIDHSNTVNMSPIHYSKNDTGGEVPVDAGQVILANSTEISIEDQNLSEVCVGLLLGFSDNNTISNVNTSQNGFYGVRLEHSDNNTIKDSDISESSDGINIRSSNFNNIRNVTISDHYRGIIIWDGSHSNEVIDSRNTNNRHGIYIYQSNKISIEDNNISENDASGISMSSSNGISIVNNELWKNEEAVSMSSSSGNLLKENNLNSSGILIDGQSIQHWNTHVIDTTNIVDGFPIYYLKNETQGEIPSDASQVVLANCSHIDVHGLDLNNVSIGIQMGFSDNNTVSNNLLKDNLNSGLQIVDSHGNVIRDNQILRNGYGFEIRGSTENHVYENGFEDNIQAIYLWSSDINDIKNNNILENEKAVYLFSSNNNVLNNNTILENLDHAFFIRNSQYNRLSNNTISENNEYGIGLDSSEMNTLENNEVSFHEDGVIIDDSERNVIINNTVTNTNRFGIYLGNSQLNTVGFNDISNNLYGIWLYASDENHIHDNSFNIEKDRNNEDSKDKYDPESVILRFDTDIHQRLDSRKDVEEILEKKADNLASKVNGRTSRVYPAVNGAEISLGGDISVEEAINRLSSMSEVLYAEPNYLIELAEDTTSKDTASNTIPDDPGYDSLWGMDKIDASSAWNQTTGSEEVVIGIIDTGIDYHHEDLVKNMWEDKEGYHGYNAVNESYHPIDGHGHGTHVAGTIGAVGDNELGVVGVNWNVSLMALKMFDDSGSGTIGDAVACLEYVLEQKENGVNVVTTSNSWGGPGRSEMMYEIIEEHRDAGISMVAAAGNDGENNDQEPTYPANYELTNVISVAATDEDDELASFSNYGENSVHVAAPGVDINSTWMNDRYEYASGTSMSTPHVSGLIGLLSAYDPSYDHTNLKNIVLSSGDRPGSIEDLILTERRINASNAIETSPDPDEPYFWMHRPTNMSEHSVTSETDIMVSLTDGVDPIHEAEVYVEFSTDEDKLYLEDDGSGSDEPGDGYYTGTWIPTNFGVVELEITAQVDDWQETRNVSVFVFGGRTGISLHSSDQNKIMGNQISRKNRRGLEVQNSEKNEIMSNNISGNHGDGLYLVGSYKNCIGYNEIRRNNGFGVYSIDSKFNDLYKNNVTENLVGFNFYRSNENSIQGNDIFFNEGPGIHLTELSVENTIADNVVSHNTEEGIYIGSQSDNNTVLNNYFESNYQPIFVSESYNITIQENELSNNEKGLRLEKSDNNFVYRNHIEENLGKGIYLIDSDLNLIQNNSIRRNHGYGMDLYPGCSNSIEGNEISNNSRGISINTGSYENEVLNNDISLNSDHGIYTSTDDHTIKGNIIFQNGRYGMYLSRSDGNLIEGNELISNLEDSIYLWESNENVVRNNTCAHNIEYGVLLRDSERNWLYQNKFINNTDHAYDNGDNYWNIGYPMGGNHWDDHVEPDEKSGADQDELGSDGIVDISREIEGGGNMDMYPWTNPELSQPIKISNPNPVDIEASLNTTLSVSVDAGIHPTEVSFYLNGEKIYDETINSDGIVETDELELWYERSYNWSVEAKNVENGEVLNRTLSRTYSFSTGSQKVESFDIFVDDTRAGEEPEIELYDSKDEYGYLLEGNFTVLIELYEEIEQLDLLFEDGSAIHNWSDIKEAGEHTTVVEIGGVIESYTFEVSSSSASSLDLRVRDIEAGESPSIEILDGEDRYGNPLEGPYEVQIDIDGVMDSVDLEFSSGGAVYDDWGILTEVGEYTVELSIDNVTVSDSLCVDNADLDYLTVEKLPANISAGEGFQVEILAFDAYGNAARGRELRNFTIVSDKNGEIYNETKVTLGEKGNHTAFIGTDLLVTSDDHNITIEAQGVSSDSGIIEVVPADLDHLDIASDKTTVEAGEDIELFATVYDEYNNKIEEVTEETVWSDDVDVAAWDQNVITPETAGFWTVTGLYEEIGDTTEIIVEPSEVYKLEIDPSEEMVINAGRTINFSAEAYDVYGNLVTEEDTDFAWDNTDGSGSFEETKAGNYEVMAIYKGVTSEPLTVTVEPGEVSDFSVNVDDIDVGGRPVIEISGAEDEYGNLLLGEYSITITINEDTKTGVQMFTEGDAQFTWIRMDEDGEYTVEITINEIGKSEEFAVLSDIVPSPAEFELSNLRVEPAKTESGGEITVMIDVTNIGDETGQYIAEFYLDGEYIGSDTVTVDGGETVTASNTRILNKDGAYEVSVERYEDVTTVTVEKDEDPTIDSRWLIFVFLVSAFVALYMFFKKSYYAEEIYEGKRDNKEELKVLKKKY
ncbi:MAG: NosD domain-containing protein [Candidatus Saliniplasma sp.]